MRRLIALAAAAVLLCACQGALEDGRVTGKQFHPESSHEVADPVYLPRTTCYYDSYSKSERCDTSLYIAYYTYRTVRDPEYWTLHLESCTTATDTGERKCRTGNVRVSEDDYTAAIVGDSHWSHKTGLDA